MAQLYQVDFKQRKLIKKSILGELAKVDKKEYTCYGCGEAYSTDKTTEGYLPHISITVGKHQIPLCKNCIDYAHDMLGKGE